ncbi:MAG: glycosyl hydrolase, partial [Terriglobales bacterium]
SWTSIAANLPENGPLLAFVEDPVNPKLLFAGTEFGLWFSIDGGGKWIQLKGSFPTIAVHDLVIQAREGDLVVGTFGRGIYILDDLRPLRVLKPETLDGQVVLYPVKKALLYVQAQPLGGGGKASQGSSFYTAENPPFGAMFTYYLKEKLKTLKEKRHDAEKEAVKKNATAPYPTNDQLRAETQETAPAMFLTVSDASGRAVRRINASNEQGMNRVAWDLQYPAPELPKEKEKSEQEEDWSPAPVGPLVMPGEYQVTLETRINGVFTQVAGPEKFTVEPLGMRSMSAPDRAALTAFQQKVDNLFRAVAGALNTADELKARLSKIQTALQQTPLADRGLTQTAEQLQQQNLEILRRVRGDTALRDRNENTPPSIDDRVQTIMQNERMSSSPPPKTDQEAYTIASEEFTEELGKLRTMLEQDLPRLEKAMEQAGAPWTPGRLPEWK